MTTEQMIAAHPDVRGRATQSLIDAVEALYDCAQACNACADACLAEPMVADLRQCIRLNLDCADVCSATSKLATRRTGHDAEVIRKMLEACLTACRLCGDECRRHADVHEHCRICAAACKECETACAAAMRDVH